MILGLIAAVVAVGILGALLLWRRRRPSSPPVVRDGATEVREALPRLGLRLGALFSRTVDDAFWDHLEEALIAADVGVGTSARLVGRAREDRPSSAAAARGAVRAALLESFSESGRALDLAGSPAVVVVVGVNGSGKTTTIAKLAQRSMAADKSVLVAAADTFRAAAAEQVAAWGSRLGFDVVRGGEGSDPAAVAFDGLSAARARARDILIVDTAGRLHSKQNLMDELAKIIRVLEQGTDLSEILLVLDGSTGHNGIVQARAFTEAVGVTGAVITKLDGTARGGMAVAVERELGIPIKLIGLGEGEGDLQDFDPVWFVDAVLAD